ncbi:MAG TPA: oxygen-independent coproporphyrinogen III oxidase, partial [Actinobacteria bacterium]|nr:oxygen-independent coproporphyrinogen III oxidase [Actinomycetes bacterium]HEX21438.1 oxygen-independent coproporphyrinogen III oxidase [Actinomycetota bacterium]
FNGGDAIAATETLTKEIRLAESIFLGLRLVDGFRVTDIEEKFHCDLRKRYELVIERLSAGNLLEADKVWRLTDRGRLVADAVMSEFV